MARTNILTRGAYLSFALLASGPLVACVGDGPEIFDRMPPNRAADESWPHLADIPPTPSQGVYNAAAPDPANGETIQIDLAIAAESAERRRAAVSGPVE
ncbi:MAG: hypothetical protein WD969_03340 [Paracoccaceae bacterium]